MGDATRPEHRIDGGTVYPPVYEVIIHDETVHVTGNAHEAAEVFVTSCSARGIVPNEDSDEWWETSASWGPETWPTT